MTKKIEIKKNGQTFEPAIERLEAIVEEMESDKLPLEELLARYEEGVQLVKFCSEKLEDAGKRIEMITRDSGGKPQVSEFDPEKKSASNDNEDVRLF
ncbi:MAG: exodeoxyribonuclease VII small subunit [Verrucomicrobiota bacterium]